MTEAAIAPLAPPAVGKREHAVAPVEADDADRMAAEELSPGLWHRDDAAGRIHERLVHHHAGDEAVRHQVGLHLDDAGEPRIALRPVGQRGLSLFRRGWDGDALHGIGHAREAADALALDDRNRLTDRHPRLFGMIATLSDEVGRHD